jgi:hypothetical protein
MHPGCHAPDCEQAPIVHMASRLRMAHCFAQKKTAARSGSPFLQAVSMILSMVSLRKVYKNLSAFLCAELINDQ